MSAPDPIFAAIERHRLASALHLQALKASPEDWPSWDDPEVVKLGEADDAAWFAVLNTRPTTREGFAAFGDHLTADAVAGNFDALDSIKALARGGARLLAEEVAITGIMGAGA